MNLRTLTLLVLALVALVACELDSSAGAVDPVDEVDPSLASIDDLVAYVEEHDIQDASALLAALPTSLRQNVVLLEASESLHRADRDHPRMILFSPGARFLLALGSDPDDPRRNVIEMAELDEHGAWRLRALDLAGDGFVDDDRACRPCHGETARPIWGSYPSWPGAFGDASGALAPPQLEALDAIVADDTHLLASLGLELDHTAGALYLPDRFHAPANTVLNLELGASVAEGLARRIMASPRYASHRRDLLLAEECWRMEGRVEAAFERLTAELDAPGEAALRDRIYTLLGLDPVEDFALDARAGEGDGAPWLAGSAYLHELVAFLVLDDLIADDAVLEALFEPVAVARGRMIRDWWQLEGEARRALFRSGSEIDLAPAALLEAALGDAHDPRRRAFCERLAAR